MKNYILLFLVSFFSLMTIISCEKSAYIDSGVFTNNFPGNHYDYLKTRPELFDSLTKIIDLAGLKEAVNKPNTTFFVPANYTIRKSVEKLNQVLYVAGRDTVKNLSEINPLVWKEFLQIYLFDGVRVSNDYPQLDTNKMDVFPGQGFLSVGNNNMNIGVLYNNVTNERDGVKQTVQYAGYRQLYFSSVDITNAFGGMINTPVATSNLRTSNGVLHVLNFTKHSFGFSSNYFANRAFSMMN